MTPGLFFGVSAGVWTGQKGEEGIKMVVRKAKSAKITHKKSKGSYTRVTTAFKVIGSTVSGRLSLLQIAMSRSKLLMLCAYYRPGCRTMKPTKSSGRP
jgi:hypothetical protein